MSYEQTLLAAGIPPEQAARDSYANDMQMWRNREHPNYGRQDDADWCAFVAATSGEQE